MKATIGNNKKLGKSVGVVSRPVGDSCPPTCLFLNNGCYAERTERIYPNARGFTVDNMITEKNAIYSMLRMFMDKGVYSRFHERGDFGVDGVVDKEYVDNVRWAFEKCIEVLGEVPHTWAYTHFIHDTYVVEQLGDYISLYASVHNQDDVDVATKNGFKLFAFCSETKYKRKGGNPKKLDTNTTLGEMQVCPNQINNSITCDKCEWCVKGRDSLVFLSH